jgi:hypothetical protein
MNSLVVNGKVLDYKFKKTVDGIYAFYIGDILIGQAFKMRRDWSAVSIICERMSKVDGFKTRIRAADYMLKLQGYAV